MGLRVAGVAGVMWVVAVVGCADAPGAPDTGLDSGGARTDVGASDVGPSVIDAADAFANDTADRDASCANPDVDGDGANAIACGGTDCDDTDPMSARGMTEVCDVEDRDEDCDPTTVGTRDADGDGAVDATCCNGSGAARTCGTDCDDHRPDVGPGSGDFCDMRDNDCDGAIDESPLDAFFPDGDGDGFGDAHGTAVAACSRPAGRVPDATDCDDARAATNPGAPDICNTFDDDCDGHVDEGDAAPITFYLDADHDHYGGTSMILACSAPSSSYVTLSGDCNDGQPSVNPGALEVCDGLDDDCDGSTDEPPANPTTWHRDQDGDLYGGATTIVACMPPLGYVSTSSDCNDGSAGVHPGASEICNAADEDCDGRTDEGPTGGTVCSCSPLGMMRSCGVGICAAAMQMCTASGWSTCSVTPLPETCDTRDNDCDGMTDELPEAVATCATYPNSVPRCRVTGGCTFACNATYADCDMSTANGCEVRLPIGARQSDDEVDNCGTCGTHCIITSNGSVSTANCTGATGVCSMTCTGTRANCNAVFADGCETDRATDLNNCGACGTRCTAAPTHGSPVCTASACTFTCNAGYYRPAGMSTCLPIPPPRLVAPLSTSIVTSDCPEARFVLAAGTDGADFQTCRDRACTMIVGTRTPAVSGDGLCGAGSLFGGTYYWRARGRVGANAGLAWSPVWQFHIYDTNAATVGSSFGTTSGTILDVQGDGPADLAIGRAYVDQLLLYFGAAGGLPASASQTLSSPDGGAPGRFGIAAASAGDVNGDGFGDLIVGASGPNGMSGDTPSAATNVNTAYVYHGGATATLATRLPGTGLSTTSGFGYAVAGIGDVDRDGYGDVAVGAYNDQHVLVFLGSATGVLTTAHRDYQAPDPVTAGLFGVSIAGADLNADGYSDLIVGRPTLTPRVYVYCGSATGLGATPCATFSGTAGSNFGLSVAAGDVSGDGAPDLVVGGNGSGGVVQVFLGRATTFDTTADATWTGAAGSGFGVSVAVLGEFVGTDELSDIAVGSPGTMNVFVFRGSSTPFASGTTAMATVTLTSTTAVFGRHIASAGAIHGGYYSDLVVGGCNAGSDSTCANTIWGWYGTTSPIPATPDVTRTGTSGFGLACDR
jgi:hypothetical protein